jgi:CTP:molybdopterin cytidylyltransferase MocA
MNRQGEQLKQTDAIVLALATKVNADLAGMAPSGRKPMIPLHGRPAVSYLVRSLKQCELVSKVIVVTDQSGSDVAGADVCIQAGSDLSDCVLAGIRAASSQRCLIMNGDMPLASPPALTDLLESAPDCDVVYPIAGRSDMTVMFPDRRAFYVETKDGGFTGSSCLLFDSRVALSRQQMLTKLLSARSNPKELLGLLGPALAMKLMLTKVSLNEFETHLSRVLDMTCRVFVTRHPEMLVSIDTARDVPLMESALAET